jgi:L-amino acid N-acyltransferase YncA
MIIRQATENDAAKVKDIYNWYIGNTIITFETMVLSTPEMATRIREKLASYDWLIGEIDGCVIGYAYYGSFRPRAAYAHTVESTVYLSRDYTGRGYGKALYAELIRSAKERGFRELVGVIALPNPASVAIHEALGFSKAGLLKNVGSKFGNYIDVGIWQLSI